MVEVVKRLEIIEGRTPRVRLTMLGLGVGINCQFWTTSASGLTKTQKDPKNI